MTNQDVLVGTEIYEKERHSFLNARGHGVLGLGHEYRGYAIPISFGYDEETDRLIIEFVNPRQQKSAIRRFIRRSDPDSLRIRRY